MLTRRGNALWCRRGAAVGRAPMPTGLPRPGSRCSLGAEGEAVQTTRAADAGERRRITRGRVMRAVPRAAEHGVRRLIAVPHARTARIRRARRPVVARVVRSGFIDVELTGLVRARQDVVLVLRD